MRKTDPRQFGRRKADRRGEREAVAAVAAVVCIAIAAASFGLGYWLDDPEEGSAFAYLLGFGLLFVALGAAYEAAGLDPDEEA